jgi:hypothetical protein
MFNNINLYKPDKLIRLNELKKANEIYSIVKKMNTKACAYGICFVPRDQMRMVFLKAGMTAPSDDRINQLQQCERIVRQVSNLEGWSEFMASDHGTDFIKGVRRLVAAGVLPEDALNRNNYVVGIWTVNPNFRKCLVEATLEEQAEWIEGELCQQHKNDFKGLLPLLNKRDPTKTKVYKLPRPLKEITDDPDLFEF